MKKQLAAAFLLAALLCGCAQRTETDIAPQTTAAPASAPSPTEEPTMDVAAETLASLSAREKVGQLFFIRPDSLDASLSQEEINDTHADGVKEITAEDLEMLAEYPVGGFCIFGKNLQDAARLNAMQQALIGGSGIAPVFAIDEEGGAVARLARSGSFAVPTFAPAAALAADGDTSAVYNEGLTIGTYLKEYGFTLDFAPVADVNTNPDNPVIGDRAYGSDPEVAAEMVTAAVQGFHDGGVGCVLKHFPGHGDTGTDTHTGSAESDKTWEEMQSCEMLPFEAGIAAGADAVMTAHIETPNATTDGLPASLSYQMITEKLRGELGFDGLVITDSLAMDAVTNDYTAGEAAIMLLNAGADVVLMPNGLAEAFDAVLAAVEDGTISEERLDESVYRILKFKEKYGLLG